MSRQHECATPKGIGNKLTDCLGLANYTVQHLDIPTDKKTLLFECFKDIEALFRKEHLKKEGPEDGNIEKD